MIERSLQRVISCLAADRCYACGWPLGSCKPFNCAMRYRDDSAHLAEKENWHARAKEMSDCLTWAVGQSTELLAARPEVGMKLQTTCGTATLTFEDGSTFSTTSVVPVDVRAPQEER